VSVGQEADDTQGDSMANDLYQVFLQAAGQQSMELGGVRYALEEVIAQLGVAQQQQAAVQRAQAQAAAESRPQSQASSNGGGVASTVVDVLKNGLGIGSLIGGLVGLFSGGSDAPPPLVKYALPAAVNIAAAESGGQLTTADYDQMGLPRAYAPASAAGAAAQQGAQITVNVQAMDARSFLDRSGDIAMAVRDAMLNLNSINDVVNDL
jgi:hypothetical protein